MPCMNCFDYVRIEWVLVSITLNLSTVFPLPGRPCVVGKGCHFDERLSGYNTESLALDNSG